MSNSIVSDVLAEKRSDENIRENLKDLNQAYAELEFFKNFSSDSLHFNSKDDIFMVRWWDEDELLIACRYQNSSDKYAVLVYDLAASKVQDVLRIFDSSGAMIVHLLNAVSS